MDQIQEKQTEYYTALQARQGDEAAYFIRMTAEASFTASMGLPPKEHFRDSKAHELVASMRQATIEGITSMGIRGWSQARGFGLQPTAAQVAEFCEEVKLQATAMQGGMMEVFRHD